MGKGTMDGGNPTYCGITIQKMICMDWINHGVGEYCQGIV